MRLSVIETSVDHAFILFNIMYNLKSIMKIVSYTILNILCLVSAIPSTTEFVNQDDAYDKVYYKISMVSSEENPGTPVIYEHAESPVWDAETQSLYFVDALAQNIHRLDYATGKIRSKHITYGQVNVVSLVRESQRLLVGVRSSLFLLDWEVPRDDGLRLLATLDEGRPDNVINEGKADASGRFWVGTKGPQTGDDVLADQASLYSVEQHSATHPRLHLRPVSISNGIVWSLNNTVMYYVDSPTRKVEAFDFDLQSGEISNRRTVVDISQHGFSEDAIPDGMTIDTDGNLWVAIMFGGAVMHINPETNVVLYIYKLPVPRVMSVCWGGPALDELFVTTGRGPSSPAQPAPLAGAVFTLRGTGFRGLSQYAFKFHNADYY